ncbi:MAG: glycosyltransferase, partial [Ramlibacter sp.]
RHLPYLFTASELAERKAWHERCLRSAGVLVSSESAHRDLLRFYPEAHKVPVFVAPFASFLPDKHPSFGDVRKHYNLPERYFFCANQFWIHKNHVVILAALRELAHEGIRPHVCFSGKEFDSRATGYATYLRELAQEWGVMDQVHFLGFLPRQDQIAIMEHTVSIIQPSRFEGWSTVIEDAKALNQHVIASDLDVHREQMSTNCDFFEPSDHARLAQLVKQYWATKPRRSVFDYRKNQRAFGTAMLSTFQALARAHPLPPRPVPDRRSPISSTINAEDLFGLSFVERGNGQWNLGTFQWMEGGELLISGKLVPRDLPVLRLVVRNIHEGQRVTLEVNGQRIGDAVGLAADISRRQELVFDLKAHAGRECDMKLSLALTSSSDDRELGLLVENVDFVAEDVAATAMPA